MKHYLTLAMGAVTLVVFVGCSREMATTEPQAPTSIPVNVDGTKYILDEEPAAAADVIRVRDEAQDNDDILIVGRIGGNVDPWVKGRAAFSIVDNSLRACTDIPGDTCPTPWDYCCEGNLSTGMALVKFVDDQGNLLQADARELLHVKELSTVVVQGTAKRDEAGNLTVLASGIYVRE